MTQVLVEHDPSPMKLEVMQVDDWPCVKEPEGQFERDYSSSETSYIAEGAGNIELADGSVVMFGAGDLLTVMPETCCVWNITEAIERYYSKG